MCIAQHGYESLSAFGYPICQLHYSDAGKTCSGKADCLGQCRLSVDGPHETPRSLAGQAAKGLCTAERYSPGCFVTIEGGKVTAGGAICEE